MYIHIYVYTQPHISSLHANVNQYMHTHDVRMFVHVCMYVNRHAHTHTHNNWNDIMN